MEIDREPQIIKVSDLLKIENLSIPDYQRPYKWTPKNINQLIDDIFRNIDKSAYRLGTIVINESIDSRKTLLNIVDGQQRTLSIYLITRVLLDFLKNDKEGKKKVPMILNRNEKLEDFEPKSIFSFTNKITQYNLYTNYQTISRRIKEFTTEAISFFFHKCELVQVVITDVSEAFQFFDSQNARGKDLVPHDLLKAFHLREMNNLVSESEKKDIVNSWESINTSQLTELFGNYLFRIKNWSKGKTARYFTKDEVDVFKGISPNIDEAFPFAKIYRIANYYTEEFNSSYNRFILGNTFEFPYQIDQVVINGKRFFEMIYYYEKMKKNIENKYEENHIFQVLNGSSVNNTPPYAGRYRTGDCYIYNLFMCALIYYVDKFGEYEIERAIDKIFIWAYTLRLKLQNVGLDSIDNYALNKAHGCIQLFKTIREAISPKTILNMHLETLSEVKSTKTGDIEQLFKGMKYYE
ncbi:MAG: DUF262 domain-containing protein [Treponema sp.]|nr:DUF262 domain-containing protein [Treponema sp.]